MVEQLTRQAVGWVPVAMDVIFLMLLCCVCVGIFAIFSVLMNRMLFRTHSQNPSPRQLNNKEPKT